MARHIPFINGETDCRLVTRYYKDSPVARVCLDRVVKLGSSLPDGMKLWIDAAIDGLDQPFERSKNKDWRNYISQFSNYEEIGAPEFQGKPDASKVKDFVCEVLDRCITHKPAAISVPQLPLSTDASRNRINRSLAEATGRWREAHDHKLRLVLPVVLTSQNQTSLKAVRKEKIKAIVTCLEKSRADRLWVVDSSLSDQKGMGTFRNKRFPDLVRFHEELTDALPDGRLVIAGPYWGMNLLLWARGLCDYPAIGVGSSYQYHISGGVISTPVIRIALPPLRRWAQVAGLKKWLADAMSKIGKSDPAFEPFQKIHDAFATYSSRDAARAQIAAFYKQWCDEIEIPSPDGRPLALYQVLSSAYALGKTLPDLPAAEQTARRPERIAEALMLNCL